MLPYLINELLESQTEQMLKVFLIFTIIFLSAFYLFFVQKNLRKTTSLMLVIGRMIILSFSFGSLVASPIIILSTLWNVSLWDVYYIIITIYSITFTITGIGFVIDFIRGSTSGLIQSVGYDLNDPASKKLYEDFKRFIK